MLDLKDEIAELDPDLTIKDSEEEFFADFNISEIEDMTAKEFMEGFIDYYESVYAIIP